MNATDPSAHDHTVPRAPRTATRHHCPSTCSDSYDHDNHPEADHRNPRHKPTLLTSDPTEFRHALAFGMRRAVVAGVASC
jgi:hypothetical protein